jgi:hypothetical protein
MAGMRHTRRRRARPPSLADKLRHLLAVAESDPQRFRAECAAAAARLGINVEQVYQIIEGDPRFREALKDAAVNAAVSRAARFVRGALGL